VAGTVTGVTVTNNVSDGDIFGAGGVNATDTVTVLASTITGNVNVGEPGKANTYGGFKT
jgi:hypothetical protein